MKQSLIFSVCIAMLAALGINAAQADVDVALNLRYTDPADPNEGGTWTLVAKTDDPNSAGITGLVTRFTDGSIPAAGSVNGSIGHDINGGAFVTGTFVDPNGPDFVEFVYGQDPNDGVTNGVGQTGGPSDQGADPLGNSVWDNASIIATGAFTGLRPTTVLAAANETISGVIVSSNIGDFNVRGDSLSTLGLESGTGLFAGDANRDGAIGPADLGAVGLNWSPTGTTAGWDDGDFNDDGAVGPADLGAVGLGWDPLGNNYTPPAIGAVPEPTTLALVMLGALGLGVRRRQ